MSRPRLNSSYANSIRVGIESESWNFVRKQLQNDTTNMKCAHKTYTGGNTALHLVCQHNPPIDIVQKLLDANPHAVQKKNLAGEIPLHLATGHNLASLEVIDLLVKTDRKTVGVPSNSLKQTALHQACTFHAPLDVIYLLIDAYPEAIHQKDELGRTPFDISKSTFPLLNPSNWKVLYKLSHESHGTSKNLLQIH